VVTIQEGHFTTGLDPDFVFRVFGHDIKTRDAESELSSFSEFSDVDSCTQKLLFGYIGAEGYKLAIDVEDFVLDETENRLLDGVFDKIFERVTNVIIQFGEENLSLLVSQGTHRMLIIINLL